MLRRHALAQLAASLSALPMALRAQSAFPTRPITIVVPYPAGAGTDIFARLVAPIMSEGLGQPVVVENRPGASGMIAANYVARVAPADGHTILLGDLGVLAVNPLLNDKVSYDVQKDLVPVTLTAKFEFVVVVNPQVLPVNSIAEMVAASNRTPGGLNYASPSTGTPHHLAMELLARQTGAKLVAITYKGAAPALTDLLGGQVGLMYLDRATAGKNIESGKLRAIASAGERRLSAFPNVPTLTEQGVKDGNVIPWQGFMVRTGSPESAVNAINSVFTKAVTVPDVVKRLGEMGADPIPSTPAQFGAYLVSETNRWRGLIRDRGIKAD